MAHTDAEREVIEKALQKIYEIRHIKNERRIQVIFPISLRNLFNCNILG